MGPGSHRSLPATKPSWRRHRWVGVYVSTVSAPLTRAAAYFQAPGPISVRRRDGDSSCRSDPCFAAAKGCFIACTLHKAWPTPPDLPLDTARQSCMFVPLAWRHLGHATPSRIIQQAAHSFVLFRFVCLLLQNCGGSNEPSTTCSPRQCLYWTEIADGACN